MNLERIWEKHRKFLTRVAGAVAVFMVLFFFSDGMLTTAQDQSAKAVKRNAGLRDEVDDMLEYSQETSNRDALQEQLTDTLNKVALSQNLRRDIPAFEKGSIEFNLQKKSVYNAVKKRADKKSLDIPKMEDISFDVDKVSEEEWLDRCLQLEVVERVLNAAVDFEAVAVEAVEPGETVQEAIRESRELVLLRVPVEVRLRITYENLMRLLEDFQSESKFLALELVSLAPASSSGELTATIRACAIDLGKAREERRSRRRSRASGRER